MDNKDEIYNPKDIAKYLLLNNENMNNLSSQLFTIEKGIYNTKYDQLSYKFEILINITFEIIFKYIELLGEMNKKEEDISKYSIEDIENLIKPRLLKISILSYFTNIKENIKKNNYCRIIINNLCDYIDQKKFFGNNSCKFHFILNSNFDKTNIIALKDIYALFELNNKFYKIYFENIIS